MHCLREELHALKNTYGLHISIYTQKELTASH